MMLSKKGGVCLTIGVLCCIYIPNSTASNGTITKAIQGLMIPSLSGEMVWEMEGLDDLNLNLLGHNGWNFNFSKMLHNPLCLRTNTAVN
jgi:hypothetical protein